MKLTVTDTYDVAQISDTQAYKELQDFIEYVNTFNRDIVRSYFNGITLNENVTTRTVNLDIQHGVPIVLPNVTSYTISSINSRTPIRSYTLSRNASNALVLTVRFDQAIQVASDQAVWSIGQIIRYRLRDTSHISIGDFVTFSGFGTAVNNGTFMVTKIDGNYLYVLSDTRNTNTADETKTGFVGSTDAKINISASFIL